MNRYLEDRQQAELLAGIDIGGTKCAVSVGEHTGEGLRILAKQGFPTPEGADHTVMLLLDGLKQLLEQVESPDLRGIGISCGGPLDSNSGMILSPPNLPGWDRVNIVKPFKESFGVPVFLQNDANACALAEWMYGAGKGSKSMVFLTFGTGMGAGLILDGKLYEGVIGMAGEVGHIRLSDRGPVGYGKKGTFEGYCSGGGIARLVRQRIFDSLMADRPPYWCLSFDQLEEITAKQLFEAAEARDSLALEIVETVGKKLGQGLAIIVDLLNPEKVVIGSIYARQQKLLEPYALESLALEAIPVSRKVCEVVPAALGEEVGDYAALSVAAYGLAEGGGSFGR